MKISLPLNSPLLEKSFVYGVATSSFQIEGASDLREPCIWDTFCDTPGKIKDASHGHIACDHYHRWQQDVELIASLGADAYRFSLSWPRIMCQDGSVNRDGLGFYIQLLDELNSKGIKPFVTLYHWDLPQWLEDNGGWLNRETAYKFAEYTQVVVEAFGDRVHSYATLNEPFCSAHLGYELGVHAPGLVGRQYGKKAAHHLLLAHGLAMQVLRKLSPGTLNGIVLNFTPCYPLTDSEDDLIATRQADEYLNHWYIKPLFDGVYPEVLNDLPQQHLPDIQAQDMQIIQQPLDFLGINYYTRLRYQSDGKGWFEELPHQAPTTHIGWEVHAPAFTELLVSLNRQYALPPIYITENGAAMDDNFIDRKVQDLDRLDYYQQHLTALHKAALQGVDIQGYFAWSLMDNFEWAEGYLMRFGIVYVDYNTLERIPKASAIAYQNLITGR